MEEILSIDYSVFKWINEGWSNSVFDIILVYARNLLTWAPLYIFVIFFYFINFGKKGYWLLLFTLLTVGSSDMVSSRVVKPSIERPRPCHNNSGLAPIVRVKCGSGFSFTSSHATNHFALATFWFFTFGFYLKRSKWLVIVWAGTISVSQVYVGVHYPSDILAGSLVGILIGFIWSRLFRKYYAKYLFTPVSHANV